MIGAAARRVLSAGPSILKFAAAFQPRETEQVVTVERVVGGVRVTNRNGLDVIYDFPECRAIAEAAGIVGPVT